MTKTEWLFLSFSYTLVKGKSSPIFGHFDIFKGTYSNLFWRKWQTFKMGKIEKEFVFRKSTLINMLIFAKIQFWLSSLTHLFFSVTFLQLEQLWANFQINTSGQCPEFHGETTFFATKVENIKNGGL